MSSITGKCVRITRKVLFRTIRTKCLTETLTYLLPSPPTSTPNLNPDLNINLPNSSGNTPLHWAALNGHLDAVKFLISSGADPAVRNQAGHDAVFEAEKSGKEEVVRWLLSEGRGLERSVTDGGGEKEAEEEEEEEAENEGGTGGREKEYGEKGEGVGGIENGFEGMELGKPA